MAGLKHAAVLVTGASGFIGSHLVERLLAADARVRCLVRATSSLRYLSAAGIELCHGDLANGEGLEAALDGVEIVFHLAGVTKALRPEAYYAGNVRATENLARACRQGLPRLVHVSTLAAAGPNPSGVPTLEDATPSPVTHYGLSKLRGEQVVRQTIPDAVIVRPPVVYGPRDTDVFQVLRSIRRGVMPRIGRQEAWFSIVYVKDLVAGLLAAAVAGNAAGKTYFLAHADPVSWSEFAATAARLMGRKARVLTVPRTAAYLAGLGAELWSLARRRPGIVSRDKVREACCPYWTCDTGRARSELGFCAQTSLQDGLRETLDWYGEAGWLS